MKYSYLISILLFALISCEHLELPQDSLNPTSTSSDLSSVRIHTRSSTPEDLIYPLHIYAFRSDGSLVASQQLDTPSSDLSLSLPQSAPYHIVALSADPEVYNLPDNPTSTSLITMKAPQLSDDLPDVVHRFSQGFTTSSPLQMGSADITPITDKTTVNIQLNYQVASVDVTLNNLPKESSLAFLSISSPSQGLDFTGSFSGTQSTRIPLTPSTTSSSFTLNTKAYVFPTKETTTFTISYTDAEGEQYASVNYLAPLKPNTPYTLQGTYSDGSFQVTGTVTPSAWDAPVQLDFTFNADAPTTVGSSTAHTNPQDPSSTNPTVSSSIPQPLTLYNGHIVVAVYDSQGNQIHPQAVLGLGNSFPASSRHPSSGAVLGSSSASSRHPSSGAVLGSSSVSSRHPSSGAVLGSSSVSSRFPSSGAVLGSASGSSRFRSSGAVLGSDPRSSSQQYTLLLLSLSDYSKLSSAQNTTNPTQAFSLADSYSEYDLTDSWRIPTSEEATLLRQLYLDHTDTIDSLLFEAQADPIVLTDDKGNNLRYLCSDATETYSFKSGSSYQSLKAAGSTVRTYRLRLVRTLKLTLEP